MSNTYEKYATFDSKACEWSYLFVDTISDEDWDELVNDENKIKELVLLLLENVSIKGHVELMVELSKILKESIDE